MKAISAAFLLILLLIGTIIAYISKEWYIAIGLTIFLVIAICIVILIIFIKINKKNNYEQASIETKIQPTYTIKSRYVSYTEDLFFDALKKIIGDRYLIYPQVPLSQIIEKEGNSKYRNELFRIVDFCIFTKNYKPLVCIEINDETHHEGYRIERDKKVHEILSSANMPLITLWTEYGIKPDYIRKRLQEHLTI